ncbi:MAG: hypothetical protein ACR2FF_06060 [Mycobacteriales bacterium]|nr:MAG: hypothetical protein DLM56_12560 [Pseudonocardiales bacterium]
MLIDQAAGRSAATASLPRRIGRRLWTGHLLFGLLFGAGTLLRLATIAAYRPAFIYPDSVFYLDTPMHVPGDQRTTVYTLIIKPLARLQGLDLIQILQHLSGLVAAVVIYQFLRHWGCGNGWSAIAAAPILLDPLQVILEHYVLTDVPAEVLAVIGLAVVGWRRVAPPPGMRDRSGAVTAAVVGLLFGITTLIRTASVLLIVVGVGYILLTRTTWRRRIGHALIAVIAFGAPVLAYADWMHHARGAYGLTYGWSGRFLYGRVSTFADCTGLDLDPMEQSLCPVQPPSEREESFYMWNSYSPQWQLTVTYHVSLVQANAIARKFSRTILVHQPLDFAKTVGADFIYNFNYRRGGGPEDQENWFLAYHNYYPAVVTNPDTIVARYGGSHVGSYPRITRMLVAYGHVYLPGTVAGVGVLLALAGGFGLNRRARRSGMRLVSLLIGVGLIAALLVPAVLAIFSLRYTISVIPLALMGGVLGGTALFGSRSDTAASPGEDLGSAGDATVLN